MVRLNQPDVIGITLDLDLEDVSSEWHHSDCASHEIFSLTSHYYQHKTMELQSYTNSLSSNIDSLYRVNMIEIA